jgi:hypothetical protein
MAEENEHIQMLIAARENQVLERRKIVTILAEKFQRGHSADNFISVQSTIEALERAITHERVLAGDWNPRAYPNPFIFSLASPGPL